MYFICIFFASLARYAFIIIYKTIGNELDGLLWPRYDGLLQGATQSLLQPPGHHISDQWLVHYRELLTIEFLPKPKLTFLALRTGGKQTKKIKFREAPERFICGKFFITNF